LDHEVEIEDDSGEEKLKLVEGYFGFVANRFIAKDCVVDAGGAVRSKVMVGYEGVEDTDAVGRKNGRDLEGSDMPKLRPWRLADVLASDAGVLMVCEEVEPDINMEAAAEVVDAMAVAETGSGWLWVPSYVVISMDMSAAHLWTYKIH
jgi:hypothetical protein